MVVEYDTEKAQQRSDCQAGDPRSPAQAAGLRGGDVVTRVDGVTVTHWQTLVDKVRKAGAATVNLTYERGGETRTARVDLVESERPKYDEKKKRYLIDAKTGKTKPADLEKVGTMGVAGELGDHLRPGREPRHRRRVQRHASSPAPSPRSRSSPRRCRS